MKFILIKNTSIFCLLCLTHFTSLIAQYGISNLKASDNFKSEQPGFGAFIQNNDSSRFTLPLGSSPQQSLTFKVNMNFSCGIMTKPETIYGHYSDFSINPGISKTVQLDGIKMDEDSYLGFGIRYNNIKSKLGFRNEITEEDYLNAKGSWDFCYGIDTSAKAIINSGFAIAKGGMFFALDDVFDLNGYLGIELNSGFGWFFYQIDPFVTGALNADCLNDPDSKEVINESMVESNTLAELVSEPAYSFGAWIGYRSNNRFHIGIAIQYRAGLKYKQHYPGHWVDHGAIDTYHEADKHSMGLPTVEIEMGISLYNSSK